MQIMPVLVQNVRDFLTHANRPDARKVTIKRNKNNVKFKIRCSRYLYVYVLNDLENVDRIKAILPINLAKDEIKK
ncbi:60S ribosomal protein L38 [Cichlidogyrus casuarinus]|uniref:Large ribosomal subunit protein eL38 n=1 Tax=Cichlidogyrus casuarinus TaxID=1844966 RepID=A0ABD2Q770_9PLAT